jgi:hypothetical protein
MLRKHFQALNHNDYSFYYGCVKALKCKVRREALSNFRQFLFLNYFKDRKANFMDILLEQDMIQ